MMTMSAASAAILAYSIDGALALLTIAFVLIGIRIIAGPTLPDRIVALDMLVTVAIGFIAAIGLKSNYHLYIDIAITLGLVGFLATVAFARFILVRGLAGDVAIQSDREGALERQETAP